MAVPTYNEHAGVEFTAEFTDVNGTPALPETVDWRLVCATTGTVLVDWTAVPTVVESAGGITTRVSVEIAIAGASNALQNRNNARELKTLLVVADKDAADEYSVEYPYYVKRTGRS